LIKKIISTIDIKDKFIALFFLKAILIYLLWYLIYEQWLLEDGFLDNFLINHLVLSTQAILNLLGFETFQYADAVGVDGTHGVLIGAPCNGLDLFALFAGFIIIFPGKIIHKVVFIPIGILVVHILNIFRLVALALIVVYYPNSLQFNHKYTFTIVVYLCIFFMWIYWVKKYASLKSNK